MRRRFAVVVTIPFAVVIVVQGCAQFSSGQCTDKAQCDPNEASAPDVTTGGDAPIDVVVDTVVGPDGNVPDGECNGGVEDCANGKDDNCNGLIDCEDPVCQGAGYVCTAPPPSGWTGPVAFFSVAGGTVPSCAGAYAVVGQDGHDGLGASPATCGCACSNPPTNVSCNGGVGVTYYTDSCVTSAGGAGLPPNFCVNTGSSSVTHVKGYTQATGYNGDCTATPSKTVPAVTWSNSYAACTYAAPADTGGCKAGAQCVQSPTGGAWTKPCVFQSGDVACPGTPYVQKGVFYTSVTDTRSCATCTCTASAGTCSATINSYAGVGCNTSIVASVPTDSQCYACPGCISSIAPTVTTTPGTCGNNGTGGPTGAASASGAVTVCCAL